MKLDAALTNITRLFLDTAPVIYFLTLTDALQIAVALDAGCEAFLTNDAAMQRVNKLRVLVLDELKM